MSMAFLLGSDESPAILRGPMVTKYTQQFLRRVAWGELDYLVLDLPPGTGDIQLTIVQTVALSGAVIVTTPQEVALIDARKAVEHVRQDQRAGARHRREHELFPVPERRRALRHLRRRAADGARRRGLQVPLLGEIPIDIPTREAGRQGPADHRGRSARRGRPGVRGHRRAADAATLPV